MHRIPVVCHAGMAPDTEPIQGALLGSPFLPEGSDHRGGHREFGEPLLGPSGRLGRWWSVRNSPRCR